MDRVLEFESTGEYREERLFLLATVKRQEKKLDDALEKVAVAKADLGKVRTDLNEVGNRARALLKAKDELTARLIRMEVKAGLIAGAAGIFTAVALEGVKRFLFK